MYSSFKRRGIWGGQLQLPTHFTPFLLYSLPIADWREGYHCYCFLLFDACGLDTHWPYSCSLCHDIILLTGISELASWTERLCPLR